MRHKVSGRKFGRNSSWRKATLRDIAKATLLRQRIITTKMRAKEARRLVERLITLGKKNTLAAKRRAFSILCDHKLVSVLFNTIATRFKDRLGGYTRIIPLAMSRRGDNASLVYLELTERDLFQDKKKTKETLSKSQTAQGRNEQAASMKGKKTHREVVKKQPVESQNAFSEEVKDREKTAEKSPKKIIGGIKKIFKKESPPK